MISNPNRRKYMNQNTGQKNLINLLIHFLALKNIVAYYKKLERTTATCSENKRKGKNVQPVFPSMNSMSSQ